MADNDLLGVGPISAASVRISPSDSGTGRFTIDPRYAEDFSTFARYADLRQSNSTVVPLPPTPEESDLSQIKGQLLVELLKIEVSRCNAKSDEEERSDSLAGVMEGADNVVDRVRIGLAKYMELLGSEEDRGPVNPYHRSNKEIVNAIGTAFGRNGFILANAFIRTVEVHPGGHGSPEDQITITFSVPR